MIIYVLVPAKSPSIEEARYVRLSRKLVEHRRDVLMRAAPNVEYIVKVFEVKPISEDDAS